jgi:hypothetical protein
VTVHRKIQLRAVWYRKIWFGLGKYEFISEDLDMISQILDLSVYSESLGRDSSSSLYMYMYVAMIISPNQAPCRHRHGSLAVVESRGTRCSSGGVMYC